MPQHYITQAVIQRLKSHPRYPSLAVLDLSCGEGEILTRLSAEGCDCRGTHFCDHDYILRNPAAGLAEIPVAPHVDLTAPLPYAENTFDVVLLIEVLEHLERHDCVLAEAARVLKPDGILVFTTPNVHRLHSRWQYLLTGTHKLIRRPVGWDIPPAEQYAYHIRPVDFPTAHTYLHHAGLHVSDLGLTHFKWRHAWWLLFYPLLWLVSQRHFRGVRDAPDAYADGRADLKRWMLHPWMLSSEQLMVTAIKSADRQQSHPAHAA